MYAAHACSNLYKFMYMYTYVWVCIILVEKHTEETLSVVMSRRVKPRHGMWVGALYSLSLPFLTL